MEVFLKTECIPYLYQQQGWYGKAKLFHGLVIKMFLFLYKVETLSHKEEHKEHEHSVAQAPYCKSSSRNIINYNNIIISYY